MSKKKRKRAQPPEPPIARFMRRNEKWVRRFAITAGLVGVLVAVWFLADPFGGGLTAIDENGVEVRAGVIDGRAGAQARTNKPAPNFLLPDYDKKAVRLDQFEGKVVFVNFWASWCEFCEEEMPDIVRIAKRFPDDVVVLLLNRGESKGTAESWTTKYDLPQDLPNVLWLLDGRESVTREYRVSGMPQSFIVDANGIVRREIRRVSEFDEMLFSVESALVASGLSTAAN